MAVTELEQIARRIRVRDEAQAADRKRQRELIRERIASGKTWDDVQAEAKISRPTIMAALKRTD
jgi:AraC-like DNA-binding protein